MKVQVSTAALADALAITQGALERKTTIPILGNVLLRASGSRLHLAATNLELAIQTSIEAKVAAEGSITVPGRRLLEIARLLPEEETTLAAAENHRCELRCGKSRFRMVGMSSESFPVLAEPEPGSSGQAYLALPSGPLRAMLEKALPCVSTEESRYTLNGALMVLEEGLLRVVATDGHRLALLEHKRAGIAPRDKVLIPRPAIAVLSGLLPDQGDIGFAADQAHLFFEIGPNKLACRLLTGSFPKYDTVLPKDSPASVAIDRAVLAASIERVALVADWRTQGIKLTLAAEALTISAQTAEHGEASEVVTLPKPAAVAQPLEVGFNASYLLDFLKAAAPGPVSLSLKDQESVAELRALAEEDLSFRYVLMPLRL